MQQYAKKLFFAYDKLKIKSVEHDGVSFKLSAHCAGSRLVYGRWQLCDEEKPIHMI